MKSREEQLTWAKQRALICVDMGRFADTLWRACARISTKAPCPATKRGADTKRRGTRRSAEARKR